MLVPSSQCASAKPSKNGQHTMALGRLQKLDAEVRNDQKIPRVRELHLVRR
jgi:hypothetical protein